MGAGQEQQNPNDGRVTAQGEGRESCERQRRGTRGRERPRNSRSVAAFPASEMEPELLSPYPPCLNPQVYDIRGAPRAVSHIPFGAGPTMLRFQPMFTSMLMIGSASGIFMTSDIQGTGITTSNQVGPRGRLRFNESEEESEAREGSGGSRRKGGWDREMRRNGEGGGEVEAGARGPDEGGGKGACKERGE